MPPFSCDLEDLPSRNNSRKVSRAFHFLTRNSTVGRLQSFVTRNFRNSQFTVTSYDILKGYFGKKEEASWLKMGLLRRIEVLKGFLDKIRAVWSKMELLGNINVLKGFGGRKRVFGSKIRLLGKIDVLKGLLGRKGAFGSKMELLGKIDFLEGFFV